MNNNEFLYYLHGTKSIDNNILNNIYNEGLLNYRGTNMLSTMWPTNIQEGELAKKAQQYANEHGYSYVIVIKIPKYYIYPNIEKGQRPLPIWKSTGNIAENGGDITRLTPELIYGIYDNNNQSFDFNSNFSPVHNPDGLKYDDSQIEYLLNQGYTDWYNFATQRNGLNNEELFNYDLENKTWNELVRIYGEHFEAEKKGSIQR